MQFLIILCFICKVCSAGGRCGGGMVREAECEVVSKGTLVKRYHDGSITIQYRTGDVSAFKPKERAWVDRHA